MTLDKHHLGLFASTIAAGLGAAVVAAEYRHGDLSSAVPGWIGDLVSPSLVGAVLLWLALGAFVGTVTTGVRARRLRVSTALGAMALGVASLWFWLVPAQTTFVAASCHYGNVSACAVADRVGGAARDIARSNDEWVERKCVAGAPEFCRMAAARRLLHPSKFCSKLTLGAEFEVVEWCTRSERGRTLVARR